MPNPTTINDTLEEITNAIQAALARHGCHPSGSAVRSAWFAGLAASGPVALTGKPVTATIPMDLMEAYVVLQRAAEQAVSTDRYDRYDSVSRFYYKASPEFKAIAAASLTISKLNNSEGKS